MITMLARSLLIAALCLFMTVPALAADVEVYTATGTELAANQNRDAGNTQVRGSQISPEDGGTTGTRGMMRNDGNMRMTDNGLNNGTYRARATENRTNWSWLGLLGLLGLAGLMRGDNRNRDRA